MTDAVLQTEGLTRAFGDVVAVDHLSFTVHPGEVLGLLGPNGAGKTTTIRLICGLLRPDAGRVLFQGRPVSEHGRSFRTRVGVCPQEIVLWERLTCLEQLQFIGQMYGLSGAEARTRGGRLLEELGLEDRRDRQARTLSGGMQRRLNLAMALVHDPDLVVLDEPGAGLDPQSRVRVREFIRSLARRKTVLVTTHNMDEADRVADRVAILDRGKLLVADTPDALKRSAGDREVLEIGLARVADPAVIEGALAGMGQLSLDPEGRSLTLWTTEAARALPDVLGALEGADLRPAGVRVRGATLEDVFIQLTGRRLRE